MSPPSDLTFLWDVFHGLPASGDAGFEGVIAHVLSRLTGLVMRLANSGSQFGRDGTTPKGTFAIAMEGKRYRDDLRLEDLVGKIALAGHVLGGRIDLYVLAATSRVSDQIEDELRRILARDGVTLLTLDWTPHPLPPLAVALAADPAATNSWVGTYASGVDHSRLTAVLASVRADPAFLGQLERLRAAVSAGSVGIEPLRRTAAAWLEKRLADAALSQEAFGQRLTVADARQPPILRKAPLDALAAAITSSGPGQRVVAVLGEEGTGKSWLVAQWWHAQPTRPIPVFVAGRRTLRLDVGDPLGSIARLIAEQQEERRTEATLDEWRRRLERWKGYDNPDMSTQALNTNAPNGLLTGTPVGAPAPVTPRFVLVLDGLNERPALPWADLIGGLAREVEALGGRLVVTCRPVFWEMQIRPRLRPELDVMQVELKGYTDSELDIALLSAHVRASDLAPHVREFLRNPRVCRVGVHVLHSRAVLPGELTVERLLLEYWQQRLVERGNLVTHTVVEFHRILREHARAWISAPRRSFDSYAWTAYSRAVLRQDQATVLDDLTDIEEGRFLTVTSLGTDAYTFRPEALPFAIALFLIEEVREAIATCGSRTPADQLASARLRLMQILEPVQGFDLLAEVVAAAVGLACTDGAYANAGRTALILQWFSVQNVSEHAATSLEAAVSAAPDAFLDALEVEDAQLGASAGLDVLMALVQSKRDDVRVESALAPRVSRWLGRWAQDDRVVNNSTWETERSARRDAFRTQAYSDFSPAERAFVDTETVRLAARGPAADIEQLAVRVLAARPLTPYVRGFLAWGFARELTADVSRIDEDLRWLCRLNARDPQQVRAAAKAELAALGPTVAEVGRRARASLLDALGDVESHAAAAALRPMHPHAGWTRAAQFCDTDPYDPASPAPTNLESAREAAARVEPAKIAVGMGRSTDDVPLDDALPGLTRFDHERIISLLRRIVCTAPEREWGALRQLSWELEAWAPLFDAACVDALERVWDRLCDDREWHAEEQFDLVVTSVFAALTPHRTSEEQLRFLQRLPATVGLFDNFQTGLSPLPPGALEDALAGAAGSDVATARVLLVASASPPVLTPASRTRIFAALRGPYGPTAFQAANTVYIAADAELDEQLIGAALAGAPPFTSDSAAQSYWLGRALATAVWRRRRVDAIAAVSPQFLSSVVAHLGEAGDRIFSRSIDYSLARLLDPATPSAPPNLTISIDVAIDEQSILRHLATAPEDPEEDVLSLMQLSVSEASRRQRSADERRRAVYSAFDAAVAAAGAEAMLSAPPQLGLVGLVAREPAWVRAWVDTLLARPADRTLSRVANLAYTIASAFSHQDPALAAALFRHVDMVTPVVSVRVGSERMSLRDHALFHAQRGPEFVVLWRARLHDAYDDASLADAAYAIDRADAADWLEAYVDEQLRSDTPGDVARALTILGFASGTAAANRVLEDNWGVGFLGAVAKSANAAYRQGLAAAYWLELAASASDGPAFWRALTLAEGVADQRAWPSVASVEASPMGQRFDADLGRRIERAATKHRSKRQGTLFGLKVPSPGLVQALRT